MFVWEEECRRGSNNLKRWLTRELSCRTRHLWLQYQESPCHFQLQRAKPSDQEGHQMQSMFTVICKLHLRWFLLNEALSLKTIFHPTGRRTDAPVHAHPAAGPDVRSENRQRESGIRLPSGRLGLLAGPEDQGSGSQEAGGLGRSGHDRRSRGHQT